MVKYQSHVQLFSVSQISYVVHDNNSTTHDLNLTIWHENVPLKAVHFTINLVRLQVWLWKRKLLDIDILPLVSELQKLNPQLMNRPLLGTFILCKFSMFALHEILFSPALYHTVVHKVVLSIYMYMWNNKTKCTLNKNY